MCRSLLLLFFLSPFVDTTFLPSSWLSPLHLSPGERWVILTSPKGLIVFFHRQPFRGFFLLSSPTILLFSSFGPIRPTRFLSLTCIKAVITSSQPPQAGVACFWLALEDHLFSPSNGSSWESPQADRFLIPPQSSSLTARQAPRRPAFSLLPFFFPQRIVLRFFDASQLVRISSAEAFHLR